MIVTPFSIKIFSSPRCSASVNLNMKRERERENKTKNEKIHNVILRLSIITDLFFYSRICLLKLITRHTKKYNENVFLTIIKQNPSRISSYNHNFNIIENVKYLVTK